MASIMPELRPQPPPQAPARASLDFNITRNGLTNMPRELLGGFVSKLYMEFLPPWEAQQFAGGSPNRVILKFDFELPIILPTPAGPDGAFQSVRMAMLPNLPVNPDGSDNTDLGPYTTGHLCAMALERLGPSPQSIRALEFAPLVPMLTFENALRPIVERGLHLFEFDTSDGSAHGYRDFVYQAFFQWAAGGYFSNDYNGIHPINQAPIQGEQTAVHVLGEGLTVGGDLMGVPIGKGRFSSHRRVNSGNPPYH